MQQHDIEVTGFVHEAEPGPDLLGKWLSGEKYAQGRQGKCQHSLKKYLLPVGRTPKGYPLTCGRGNYDTSQDLRGFTPPV